MLTYTCNTRGAVRRALAAGADGLMSDRPGWLRRIVEAEGTVKLAKTRLPDPQDDGFESC